MPGLVGSQAPFIKTPLQRIHGKHAGIAADPDPVSHKVVRKMLVPAFNPRALKEQEPSLSRHIDGFVHKLVTTKMTEEGFDMRDVRYVTDIVLLKDAEVTPLTMHCVVVRLAGL